MNDATAPLEYKVVELSTVDERSLEQVVNLWTGEGWRLENVQFAMRESSRRPSMAFVFFTRLRQGEGIGMSASEAGASGVSDDEAEARFRLQRLAERGPTLTHATEPTGQQPVPRDAWERLRQLAEDDEEGG